MHCVGLGRCLLLGLLLVGGAAAHTGDAARARRFAGSAMPLVNPERGFRGELADFPAMANLGTLALFNITLAQVYSYMWQFCTTLPCQPLSSSYLAELDDGDALLHEVVRREQRREAVEQIGGLVKRLGAVALQALLELQVRVLRNAVPRLYRRRIRTARRHRGGS